MTKYQRRKSYWKGKCDAIYSEIIKLKAGGKCEETGATAYLQCSHIVPRIYHATRWDLENALCLHRNRHKYYTHHPVEWRRFVGERKFRELEERALEYKRRSLIDLKELHARLQAYRDSFDRRTGKFQIRDNPGRNKD